MVIDRCLASRVVQVRVAAVLNSSSFGLIQNLEMQADLWEAPESLYTLPLQLGWNLTLADGTFVQDRCVITLLEELMSRSASADSRVPRDALEATTSEVPSSEVPLSRLPQALSS